MINLDGFDQPLFGASMPKRAVKGLKQQGRGGTLTSLISEGGAAGGALAGAAAGSVVPVVGTAVGGILGAGIGAFAGRMAENKVRDDRWGLSDAAQEGALSAVLTGPLKLGKYAATAGKGLKGGMTLEKALMSGADDAAKFSLRDVAGKGVEKQAVKYSTKQFGLTDNYISKFAKRHKEDPGKVIMRNGFGSADDITNEIAKKQQVFDSLIDNAGSIKKTTLQKNFDATADELLSKFPSDQKAAGQKMLDEVRQLMDNFGDEVDAKQLNGIRKQYDELVNYSMQMADPTKHTVNKRVADVLRDTIRKSAGGELKSTGDEISKLIDLSEEVAKRAPAVSSRASGVLGFRNLVGGGMGAGVGASTGGAFGGPIGALAGMGVTAAANSSQGRRAMAKGTQLLANGVKGTGRAATPAGMAGKALAAQPIEGMLNQPQPSNAMGLEEALMDQSMPSQSQMSVTSMAPSAMSSSVPNMGGVYPNSQQPSSGAASGITRENILKAMMIDLQETGGKNLDKIQMIYEFANPEPVGPAGGKLNASQLTQSNNSMSALEDLGLIRSTLRSNPNASLLNSLPGGGLTRSITGTSQYEAARQNVADAVGRLRSGGAINADEERRFLGLLPGAFERGADAESKLARLEKLFSSFAYPEAGAGSLEDVLMQQGAY